MRTDVTYGQLDKLLESLGFSCWLLKKKPPARVYEHKESGALIVMPPFPKTDFVLDYHLVGANDSGPLRHRRPQGFRRQTSEDELKSVYYSS